MPGMIGKRAGPMMLALFSVGACLGDDAGQDAAGPYCVSAPGRSATSCVMGEICFTNLACGPPTPAGLPGQCRYSRLGSPAADDRCHKLCTTNVDCFGDQMCEAHMFTARWDGSRIYWICCPRGGCKLSTKMNGPA